MLSGAASVCKHLCLGNAYTSILPIRKSNFSSDVLSLARGLTTLRVKMTTVESTWKPNFVPVADASATAIDPKCLLRVVSYNILAQIVFQQFAMIMGRSGKIRTLHESTSSLAVHLNLDPHAPGCLLSSGSHTDPVLKGLRGRLSDVWKNRSEAVVSRLLALDADLVCLQELDEYQTFYKEILDKAGYGSVYVQRGNGKKDGCGIFFKRTRISLLSEEIIDYNVLVPKFTRGEEEVIGKGTGVEADDGSGDEAARRLGDLNDVRVRLKRDCVGIIAAFKSLDVPDRMIILANTHIFWDPILMDVKLAQVHHLASSLVNFKEKAAKEYGLDPLVIIAGDFNSLPGDAVYKYLVSGTDSLNQVKSPENDIGGMADKVDMLSVDADGAKPGEVKEWVIEIDRSSKFPLPAVSLYAYTEHEPAFTNYTYNFVGTLDYILFVPCERLKPTMLLALPKPGSLEVLGGLPNHHHPSDHLPIGCEFGLY